MITILPCSTASLGSSAERAESAGYTPAGPTVRYSGVQTVLCLQDSPGHLDKGLRLRYNLVDETAGWPMHLWNAAALPPGAVSERSQQASGTGEAAQCQSQLPTVNGPFSLLVPSWERCPIYCLCAQSRLNCVQSALPLLMSSPGSQTCLAKLHWRLIWTG